MALRDWSTTPGSNANVGSINWAEGQAPSTVNDSARQMMADVADWTTNGPEWYPRDSATYASGTTFTVPGNQTAAYTAGRRVWAAVTAGNVYGSVVSATYGTNTTVTVVCDSGSLDSGLSSLRIGPQATNTSFPTNTNQGFNVLTCGSLSVSAGATVATLAATTAAIGVANVGSMSISAALVVTGLGTLAGGLHVDGALSLSAGVATPLIINSNQAAAGIKFSSSTGTKLARVNGANFEFVASAGSTVLLSLDDSGNLTATANITAYSDENLKEDWRSLPDDFVEQLAAIRRSGTYSRIDTGARAVGVGAQSLMNILPEAVLNGGAHLSVAYGQAALVACVALCRRVLALEARIAELENK